MRTTTNGASSGAGGGGGGGVFKICPPGMPVYLPLSVLVLQTCVPLLIRLSRKFPHVGTAEGLGGAPPAAYLPASITLLAEVAKCVIAFGFMVAAHANSSSSSNGGGGSRKGVRAGGGGLGVAVVVTATRFSVAVTELSALVLPAMLYFASNVTAVYALSHVRSYIFTAIMNSRIVFAAVLSLVVLEKHISTEQWRAILIIFCSATVLCLEDVQVNEDYTVSEETIGVFISLGTAAVSAAGGVFMEKYLHHHHHQQQQSSGVAGGGGPSSSSAALWEQQCVLALFSAGFAALYVCIFHLPTLLTGELLSGWTGITATIMAMQAAQGVLVALTIARCGIVFRLILGTLSICLCILIEGILFFEAVLAREVLTIAMVIIGSNLYSTTTTSHKAAAITNSNTKSSLSSSSSSSLAQQDAMLSSSLPDANSSGGAQQALIAVEEGCCGSSGSKGHPHHHHYHRGGVANSKGGAGGGSSKAVMMDGLSKAGGSPPSGALRRLTMLLVVTLIYISFSSSFSVILASQARKEDASEAVSAAFLQPAILSAADSSAGSELQRKAVQLMRMEQQQGQGEGGGLAALARRQADKEEEEEAQDRSTETGGGKKGHSGDSDDEGRYLDGLLLGKMAGSTNSLLRAAAVTLRRQQGLDNCRLEDHFEERPWSRVALPVLPPPQDGDKEGEEGGRGPPSAIRRDVAVCVQIKNDAVIMDEYIAFHWVQGAGRFLVYDDDSSDDPWSVLGKYAGLGILEFYDMKGHPGSGSNELQTDNYNACFKRVREHAEEWGIRWIIFPDIDEFFLPVAATPQGTTTLSHTLNTYFDHSPCIEVARTYFGSSFQHKRPEGLVVENYIMASPPGSDGFPKMIANVSPRGGAKRNATALYTVHNIVDQADIPCTWMRESSKHLRINHYVRSLQDYETKVLTGHKVLNRYSKPLQLFWERDRNDALDTSAADYGCRVRAAMAQLEQIKGSIPRVDRPPAPFDKSASAQGEEIMMGVA